MEIGTRKISVIVPVFNGEATIARCIDSILGQTLEDLELIVVDDGSTDATEQICRSYKDPRLIFCHKENGGVSSARNLGLSMAGGKYVGFVDADDGIVPEMYEKMYAACEEFNADICVCDYKIVFDNGREANYTDLLRGGYFSETEIQNEALPVFLGNIDASGSIGNTDWGVMRRIYRRSFVIAHQICFDETLSNSEDCLFCYMATYFAKGLVYLKNEQLYINYRNSKSLTRRYLPDFWKQRCQVIDTLAAMSNADHPAWETTAFPLFLMRCVRPSFTNIAYGFGKVSVFRSLMEFREIVNDPRVQRMCAAIDPQGFNDEYTKLFNWCKKKDYITLFLYYMDVQHGNKLCHGIRRIQKGINRRIKKWTE